ncbi:hypothetical protein CEXT_160191, partial [Caerostris extrusa]
MEPVELPPTDDPSQEKKLPLPLSPSYLHV